MPARTNVEAATPEAHQRSAPSHVFVTDLDGTLLDHDDYSWRAAAPALAELARRGLPLVLASSKTLEEMLDLERELPLHPAASIAENGAVVALPETVGALRAQGGERHDDRRVFDFGQRRESFLPRLHRLRKEHHLAFAGFADWTDAEIARRTGLPLSRARLSARRRATEPILWSGDATGLARFRGLLAGERLDLVAGGRFHHVSGGADKGRAVRWLRERFADRWPGRLPRFVALGDSPNDATMLGAADVAVVLPARTPRPFDVTARTVLRPERPGPEGWCEAVLGLLGDVPG